MPQLKNTSREERDAIQDAFSVEWKWSSDTRLSNAPKEELDGTRLLSTTIAIIESGTPATPTKTYVARQHTAGALHLAATNLYLAFQGPTDRVNLAHLPQTITTSDMWETQRLGHPSHSRAMETNTPAPIQSTGPLWVKILQLGSAASAGEMESKTLRTFRNLCEHMKPQAS